VNAQDFTLVAAVGPSELPSRPGSVGPERPHPRRSGGIGERRRLRSVGGDLELGRYGIEEFLEPKTMQLRIGRTRAPWLAVR
jgi:hypothetical protein